jgi:two-component system, chemotaxis family, chemotaxis protein CheY
MAINILIVDDSATIRSIIKKTLQIAEVSIGELFEAANGKEALDVLGNNWIDIIFADINMPVMGGLEMIEKMNQDGLLKTIPVVVVSTEGSETRIEELRSKGIKAFIRKPFAPEQIVSIINDILGV